MNRLIQKLKDTALVRRITHRTIANHAGMKASSVTRMLSGKFDPKLSTVEKVADAVGLKLELKPKGRLEKLQDQAEEIKTK